MKTNKTLMIATLVLLCVTVLTGCSKNEPSGAAPVDTRAIRLSAGLQVASKAPVNNGSSFTAAIAGWETPSTVSYGVKRTWQTTSTIIASEAAGVITLDTPQYYSQNGAVKTYMKAWYPAGTLSDDGIVTFDGTADGTVDVLQAGEISGSAVETENAVKTLAFNHPLTQLKFMVQGDSQFGMTTAVKSITVKDAGVPTGIDLKTNAVTYTTTGLKAPGIDGTQLITPTKEIVGQPAMIRPIPSNTFKIDIETSDATYHDVVVTVTDANLTAGKAYTITLTFAGAGISAQASVTPWDNTGSGSGDVDTD